jgi:hypothetical protein
MVVFVLLCGGVDVHRGGESGLKGPAPRVSLAVCVKEYRRVHCYIGAYHFTLKHTLHRNVKVDTRLGRRRSGLYHEPLQHVLEYCGLSMNKNQTVNTSIDGQGVKRVLIPNQPRNAEYWYELYTKN